MKKDINSIEDLISDPRNARKRTERSSSMLIRSLEEVGAARSIVIDENNQILAGNGTIDAAAAVGIDKIKVIETDGSTIIAVRRSGLTKEQKTKLALYDNRTAELAEWDVEVLAELDQELDLSSLFSDADLNELAIEFQASEQEEAEDEEPVTAPSGERYPLAIVLSSAELKEWQVIKQSLGEKRDTKAFLKLMRGEV